MELSIPEKYIFGINKRKRIIFIDYKFYDEIIGLNLNLSIYIDNLLGEKKLCDIKRYIPTSSERKINKYYDENGLCHVNNPRFEGSEEDVLLLKMFM